MMRTKNFTSFFNPGKKPIVRWKIFYFTFSIWMFIQLNATAQKSFIPDSNKVTILYEGFKEVPNQDSSFYIFKNSIVVCFEGGFNDSVDVRFDTTCLFKGKLVTNRSLGTTGEVFVCSFLKSKNLPLLSARLLKSNLAFATVLDYRFKYLYINHNKEDGWNLYYSNVARTYE